jgi:hypothetical protein
MIGVVASVVFALVGSSFANAQSGDDSKKPSTPNVTREYLLAHGFKQLTDNPDRFEREHVRLRDVLGDLGVPLAFLRPTVNQSENSDIRTAHPPGLYIIVRSEVRDRNGRVRSRSLDDPDAICSVHVWRNPTPLREYLKTDSVPSVRIKSVTTPQSGAKSLDVTIEVAARGTKPLAIPQGEFQSSLTGDKLPPYTGFGVVFSEETPQPITVEPSKPVVLRITVPLDASLGVRLVSGKEYVLRIKIGFTKPGPQRFDYEWARGRPCSSNDVKFIVE